ncbi:TPA: glycosyltransferase [Pseudomonas aeruginosa]|uniref:glycosyltransferase family 2 protein n=1 Tax=Pseudomonas aeruginosa TaxID=287 RepID=UPI00106B86B9|nr:glycosyltransferase [Pseudomonas aeruginosa]MCP9256547.1 glycosyltransferase [Pseudomonas aeruginosa]MCW8029861.1 glycosyltransferase [Pseudomonas aeruginosa]WMI79280.1 glycosyltransferase [Pseudomonas aeruginosa]WMX11711.1 glycosyltransferase [Pseudomonas aeruginosa]HCF4369381.1 glycosyltransferase [Pseudomonas aeruginosa]
MGNTVIRRLSYLIAACEAEEWLPGLISKLLGQDHANEIEVVLASDDGVDLRTRLPSDPRLVHCPPAFRTGPAAARTRALVAASGSHVVQMDADDDVSDGFVEAVISALKVTPAVALRTVYVRGGEEVKRFQSPTLELGSLLDFYGSVICAAPRNWIRLYPAAIAEDVVASIAFLHLAGGRLPVVDADYRVRLHPHSFCAQNACSFTSAYRSGVVRAGWLAQEVGCPGIEAALIRMYRSRIAMSRAYDTFLLGGGEGDYHDFVQQHQNHPVMPA